MTTPAFGPPAIVGIPFDKNSSFMRGPALAPPKIREAFHSSSSNLWSESGIDLGQHGLVDDVGDLVFPVDEPFLQIEEKIVHIVEKRGVPLVLGGDHSITYPVVKGLHRSYPKLSILHFDAHPDLYDELDGNRFSHASPFARIMEEGAVTRLVQIGIRTMNGHQQEQAKRFGVDVIDMQTNTSRIALSFDSPLYISFDLDALDPAFAPGVSHIEPGGLSTRQVIDVIQRVEAPAIIGADIVELNPTRDPSGMSAMVCAKMAKEILAKMIEINR